MMKIAAVLLALAAPMVQSDLVLSKGVMDLTLIAAELSDLAYAVTAPNDTQTMDYTAFGYYKEEPDQALTAKTKNGYCFVAFRGTSLTWDDWKQNLEIGNQDICVDVAGTEKCCTSRIGFFQAYNTTYRHEVEQAVRDCAKTCVDKDECVVITGHSQGGAIAAVASMYLVDLNPYVITFGQPPTIEAPCDLIPSARMYRFVNTKETKTLGIAYDPVSNTERLRPPKLPHEIFSHSSHAGNHVARTRC
jgi:Lipase (class 3)